jgi:hypothetical protein
MSGCTADNLSVWLGYSVTNTNGFIALLNQSATVAPDGVDALRQKLSAYRGTLASQVVPPCAKTDSLLVFAMMDTTMRNLDFFKNHQLPDLKNTLSSANDQYKTIVQEQGFLRGQLNLMYAQQKH